MPNRSRSSKKASSYGELALIDIIRKRAANGHKSSALKLGIGDDCAILQPPAGHEIVVTTDFSLEGRHFRRDWHSPASVGHRTLARGLSDLASMGAKPLGAFLSLALPRSIASTTAWLNGFLDGLLRLAAESRVALAGGDLSEAPSDHILADIVLLGSAPAGTAMRRSGARAGDALYCTGALGGAAAELATLPLQRRRHAANREGPHLFPAPRLRVGELLRSKGLATACLDLSDGLSTDLAHLCDASRVGAEVSAPALPIHARARALAPNEALRLALHGGEDYELLFTASPQKRMPNSLAGVPVTRIGTIFPRSRGTKANTVLLDQAGERLPLEPAGWEHLR